MNINKCICTGRLTKDPELREVSDELSVCQLRLAVDGMGRGREVGFINVSVALTDTPCQRSRVRWLLAQVDRAQDGPVGSYFEKAEWSEAAGDLHCIEALADGHLDWEAVHCSDLLRLDAHRSCVAGRDPEEQS